MTETKLRPCPFCGGKPDLGSYDNSGNWIVVCSSCEAETKIYETKEKAVEYWNARPIEDELDKKNGYLIDTCHDLHDIVEDFRAERDQKDLEIERLREALEIYKEALHEGLWKTGLQDSIWEVIEQAEEKAEQILKGGEE